MSSSFGAKSHHKTMFAIALPMVISNIAAPLLGLVDTAIIGHLPDAIYLSAVALGAMVVSFIYLLAVFLRMSTTGLIAQAFGANDVAAQRRIFFDASLFALVIGVVVLLLSPLALQLVWQLIDANGELKQLTERYIQIRFLGAPAAMLTLVMLGVLLGLQRAKHAMVLVITTNAINVVGDVILIIGLDMNVTGAAIATVVAEWVSAIFGVYLVSKHLRLRRSLLPKASIRRLQAMFSLNRDIFIRSILLHACMAMMTAWASYQGQIYVAANAVLLQFLTLISLGLDGVAYAAEALIGEAKGKKDEYSAHVWLRVCLLWSGIFAMGYAVVFGLFGEQIIYLITNIPEVVATAVEYLPWVIALPLLAHWSYLFDGVFIGVSASKAMRNTMAMAAFGVYLPVWWFTKDLGNHGLWLALSCFMVARGVAQAWVLKRHRLLNFNDTLLLSS
ncbi:MAG TPA: MATE family efflux transporter [Aliidiomarina sp.]|nr:MATE family efflux transporter [Aliidiomarina sp.]